MTYKELLESMEGNTKRNWDNIISEKSKYKYSVWVVCIIISVGIIVLIALVNSTVSWSLLDYLRKIDNSVGGVVSNALSAVATGILGAAVLNLVYRQKENNALNQILSLPYHALHARFCEVLDELDGKYREDERIEVDFSPYETGGKIVDELIRVNIRYEFKTNKIKDDVQLKFERCKEDNDIGQYLSGIQEDLYGLEFYWGNDESDFPDGYVSDDDYKVTSATINSHDLEIIAPQKKIDTKNSVILYKIPVDKKLKTEKKMNTLKFHVSFPMEAESIMNITHEYPTNGTTVKVNYEHIANSTFVYVMEVTGPIRVTRQNIPGRFCYEYSYNDWLIPKCGYVIAWWRK